MSTPDTPPQNPPPDDSAAASPASRESSPTGDSPSNGHDAAASPAAPAPPEQAQAEASSHDQPQHDAPPGGDDGDEVHDEAAGGQGEGHEPAEAAGTQPAGEKKRRRRRRRKKGDKAGTPGVEGAAASPAEGEGEGASVEGEGPKPVGRPEKREPKREKRLGPPRERPPVNAGDIVFGKILEITDEAILIDIPGKAHAIFDRREMLIADDDDANAPPAPRAADTPRAATSASAPGATQAEGPSENAVSVEGDASASVEGDASASVEGDASASVEGDASASVEGDASASVKGDASASVKGDASASVKGDASASTPTTDSAEVHAAKVEASPAAPVAVEPEHPREPEAPREPKVPRVILEVGADFIGVVHNDGARGGLVVLTHHPKRVERAKAIAEKASQEKSTVLGLVTGVIKGGIEVDVDGLRAFAPGSHVDLRLGADLSHLVAKRLPFFVTQYAKRGRDVVLSRRSMLEEESRKARSEALAKLKVGEEIEGIVRSVVPFGAFVDVGGVEGLVPLQEMSHNRGDGPSDVFKAGEPTRVVVMKIDDKGKIWLSHRATIPDPWQQVALKYATGTRHSGKVVRLQPFGAFIELEPGVDGLLHTQDLSVKRIDTPDEVVKVGDAIEVTVAHVDPSNHKIALHPALQGEAANEAPQKVAPHKPVKAKIVAIESGGLVVRLLGVTGRNARGYVTSAGTGTPRGTELRKAFKVDQLIDAKVIEMDPRRGEVKLSIKALSEDQERSAYQQYRQQLKAEAKFTFGDLLAKKGNPPR
jgi:small subunit ribosomal protein S1